MPNLHEMDTLIEVAENISAKQRAAGAVNGTSIDLTNYYGGVKFLISAGTFGASATLDAKLQESDDDSTFTDVSGQAITQLTAAGTASLSANVRSFNKRYIRLVATSAVAAVDYGATFVGQKTKV
jgi:hypothetical protein